MRKKRLTGREKLAHAISSASPGDPGYGYVEACTFLARWVIGLSIHTRKALEGRDVKCSTPGTPEYFACQRTVDQCATSELTEKSQEIGSIGAVVVQAQIFYNQKKIGPEIKGDRMLNVPALIYDGALNRLSALGEDKDEVALSRQVFDLLSTPYAGSA